MAILSTLGLQKAYGTRVLFSDVTLEVGDKDHIGLIGANGAGKTTLFQILTGAAEPDAGTVRRAKLLDIQSLAQTPHMEEGQTAYEFALEAFSSLAALESALEETNAALLKGGTDALIKRQHELSEKYERDGGLTYKSRARAALLGLGFTEAELSLHAQDLSGGQRNKAMLARALISGAGLLLLDEPTNHLDIRASEWLEAALKSWNGAFIVISHDRYFLDQVTNRTLELSGGRLHVTNGNYSTHAQLRAGGQEAARRKYYNTQKEIRRITGIVEQQRRWNRERNIRAAESKLKQIERLKKTLIEPERAPDSVRFSFHAEIPGGNDALVAEGLTKAYGDKELFSDVSLHIRAGERVFLLGPNGCGKTTLMRILMGRAQADEGYAYFGVGVEPAYYEQDMRSMRVDASVLTEVYDAFPRMDIQKIRNALAAFLFRGQDVDKRVDMLSGGEKARVQLLKLMLSGSNLLLLDEPTNHLDIASREALERALEEYGGAMLIVTHDRYLVNRIADRVLFMANGGVTETIGGYDAYVGMEEEADAEPVMKEKNAYRLKKEQQAAFTRAKGVLKRAEEAVAGAEAEIAALEARLSQPEIAGDYQQAGKLAGEIEALRAALDALYHDWELAEQALEALNEDSEDNGDGGDSEEQL